MYSDNEKAHLVRLAAASLAAGASADAAWDTAVAILERVNGKATAGTGSAQHDSGPYADPRVVLISGTERFAHDDFDGATLEYGDKRVRIDSTIMWLFESISDGDRAYLTLDLIKKYAIFAAEGIDSRDYDSVPNYRAYNIIRDLKRVFNHLGIADAVASVKGRGWYLKNVEIRLKEDPMKMYINHYHAH